MSYKTRIIGHLFVASFLALAWQSAATASQKIRFLFGSPLLLLRALADKPLEWMGDAAITGFEALSGFILGILVGSILGFLLSYSESLSIFTKPYIIALGSIPIFAIAPMLIIWFGVGIKMKIASSFFATVLVALSQAYEGGRNIDRDLIKWFILHGSTKRSLFLKLVLPSSLNWVFSSLKLNIGFSLLGAFIGEFIASEEGLGHEILNAGGVYDFPRVLGATVCIIVLAILLNSVVSLLESFRYKIIEWISVPRPLRIDTFK